MMRLLVVDCIMRNASRTKVLLDAFLEGIDRKKYAVETVNLNALSLSPLFAHHYQEREALLAAGNLDHERFDYAKQFAGADVIVIAAPYWDMSFPSLLKIYIENICVDGITFETTEKGMIGLCHADPLIFLTTRGGFTETGSPGDQATAYLQALSGLLGYQNPMTFAANGLDVQGYDGEGQLKRAAEEVRAFAKTL